MEQATSARQLSRGEKETETEATRLVELIEEALAAVAIPAEADSLEAVADRIERASRDLSMALRELARERRVTREASE
jgi:truncated hemoglobin YjbI